MTHRRPEYIEEPLVDPPSALVQIHADDPHRSTADLYAMIEVIGDRRIEEYALGSGPFVEVLGLVGVGMVIRAVGHKIHGKRSQRSRGTGWEFVHVAIDDASRINYAEVDSLFSIWQSARRISKQDEIEREKSRQGPSPL